MHRKNDLAGKIRSGSLNERIEEVYGCTMPQTGAYAERLAFAAENFARTFPDNNAEKPGLYSAPGRTEIGGNHTDHQNGCVLAASVDLDMVVAAAPNGKNEIRFYSEGYGMFRVDLADTSPVEAERGTTEALLRGMAAQAEARGFSVSGFDVWCTSSVLIGSGLSSSAAFEVLTGVVINDLFCSGALTAMEIAGMGQKAENIWFGKPSGLMDQAASAVGGVVAIDFENTDAPAVEKIDLDLEKEGYVLCIADSRSSHADLTDAYAAIPAEMRSVAALFGKDRLRGVTEEQLLNNCRLIRERCGDRAFLRALHFVEDNERAKKEAEALKEHDFPRFLRLVNESGDSSCKYLQNTAVSGSTDRQAVNIALALCDTLLDGQGAFRVHGGGFAGTVQAFVPLDLLPAFREGIDAALGEGSCHVLSIRPAGGAVLSPYAAT